MPSKNLSKSKSAPPWEEGKDTKQIDNKKRKKYVPNLPTTISFASAGATNKPSSAVLLSTTFPADRTQMNNRICFQLLYL